MSYEITKAFVAQYSANVQLLTQQNGSLLRKWINEEKVNGESSFFDQIGSTHASRRTSRHADTPRLDTPHFRRRLTSQAFDWADLIDNEDLVKTLSDPTSKYAINASMAMGRAMDEVIVDAALGTSYAGEDGATALTGQTAIPHGSAGLTLAKLLNAKETMDGDNVDTDGRYLVCTAKQISDLLNTTEVKSADYNTVRALATGDVESFLGFKFVPVNGKRSQGTKIIPTNNAASRRCFAFQKDGLTLGIGADIKTEIGKRADKNYATQVFLSMSIGATRMDEKKVLEVLCSES